jgi:hypothetical protein
MTRVLKILGTLALMVASGFLAIVMAATFLMNLGLKLHDNYEYYRSPFSMVLMVACGIAGFAIPELLIWSLQRSRQFGLRTLFAFMTAIALLLGIYAWSF